MTPSVARLPRASMKFSAKSIAAAPRSLAPASVGGMYFTGREDVFDGKFLGDGRDPALEALMKGAGIDTVEDAFEGIMRRDLGARSARIIGQDRGLALQVGAPYLWIESDR